MQYEYIEVKTKQNIFLNGFYAKGGNKSCVLFVPGFAGNFMENKFARVLVEECFKNKMDAVFAHNQGSSQVMSFPCLKADGTISSVVRGAAYEHLEDCVYDLDAWFDFVKDYESVYLIAHSLGCNKVVHYLRDHKPTNLKKVVLLAPQDNAGFFDLPMHAGMVDEAKENIKAGWADRLLTKKMFGCLVMSSATCLNFISHPEFNNIPYKTANGDMPMLREITWPTLVVIGSQESEQAEVCMQKVAMALPRGQYAVIPNANHLFKNQEKALANRVVEFLKEFDF
ncbi:MAG: alpha/beta hydrolase [Alphaproteobacteria bacterium]|nr:alpha/beta hydrolase [Alphaproteobacteria bacterium]